MTTTILDAMTEQYNSLTRSGKKLANYIFSHTGEAQYLSITSLAESCGVSEASITRFCRALGLSGYNELKLALAKSIHTNEFGDIIDAPDAITTGDTLETTRRKLRDTYILSLNATIEQMDIPAYEQAVDLLYNARKVY